MERLIKILRRPYVGILIAAAVLMIAGGIASGLYFTQKSPPQPIDFPHSVHVGLGMQCLFCHPSAATGPVAGLPTTEKCWGCHQQIDRQTDELAKVAKFAQEKQSIPWVPVFYQPDFVRFNHQSHIAKGVSCETCHGEVGTMKIASPRSYQNMGWCLDCHQKQPRKAELTDCSTCHY